MSKKIIIIISIVLAVAIAGGTAVFLLLRDRNRGEDEFLPAGFEADIDNLKYSKLTLYFESQDTTGVSKEVLQAINSKLKKDMNTEIQFNFVYDNPENFLSKVKSDVAAGLPCDAFYYSDYFPISLETMANEGYIADLTKLFPRNAPHYYSQFTSDDIKSISINGKVYAIPAKLPGANRVCAIVRQDLMDKYKIPEIKSLDDYEVFLRTVKEKEPDMIPMNYYDTTLGLFADMYGYAILDYELGLVYKLDDTSAKIQAWEQTPVYKDCLNKIQNWFKSGYLMKSRGIAQTDEYMITSGKWASFIGRLGDEIYYNSLVRGNGITDWEYKTYELYDGLSARTNPLQSGMAINAKSQNVDRVLMFIDWLESSQENYDVYMYGVKGKHYIEKGDYIEPPEGVTMQNSFFSWGWKDPFRNIDYERANLPGLKKEVKQYYDIIKNKTKYPRLNGFKPDYSTVDDIVIQRRMSYQEMDARVYMGDYDESKSEGYINDQKHIGIDNLIVEVQKQADGFRAGH